MKNNKLKFVLDVDGVFTDGKFLYSKKGKIFKTFGPHDSDAVKIIRNYYDTSLITADKNGFEISKKRAIDMGLKIALVSEEERFNYFKKIGFNKCIFMGDGHYDADIIKRVFYGICPDNALNSCKKNADFITKNKGGEGAVYEAVIHLIKKFKLK
ncbi:MAG: phosphatase [Euryarchaeota archaeon]|mgnify:CR=1 FL=1|nr:phosphatase [Euryarchaeota archaeon]|tara:strand:- start:227 stop:691 length:465 start_codon:yes stop_codon:yes gene_type:complete